MEFLRKLMRNSNFAKTNGDKLACSIFVHGGIFTLWYELYHVSSQYELPNFVVYLNYFVAMITYAGAMTNWYKLISTRTFPFYVEVENRKESDWQYCDRCFTFCPPRMHHCKICNVCILKRDHHCWFAGSCIGYRNHRFYLVMIFYIWCAALYSNIFNAVFVIRTLGGLSIGTVFSLAFPHGAALLGFVDFYQFSICTVSFIGFFLLVIFSWLLQIQLTQIYHGQTKYEKAQSIDKYDLGPWDNLVEVLGNRYVLAVLCAFMPSPLPGDGVSFPKQSKSK